MSRVSVIMGVYNGARTVVLALDSILSQTYRNWEIIVCDDGSTDSTWDELVRYQGAHPGFSIRILRNMKNVGLAVTLNRCINFASGEYLARQDADDVSSPGRLQEQVDYLDSHPDVSVVGAYAYLFNRHNSQWGRFKPPTRPTPLDWVKGFYIIHACCMMRALDLWAVGRYDEYHPRVEDYRLWLEFIVKGYRIRTIPKVLYGIHWDLLDIRRKQLRYRITETKVLAQGIRLLRLTPLCYAYVVSTVCAGLLPRRLLYWIYLRKFAYNPTKEE